jgi:RimJ/RimL family protein N-acetyltransferase
MRTHRRPDGRFVVWPNGAWTPDQAQWAVDFARTHGVTVITHLATDRTDAQRILADAGFTATRREVTVEVNLDEALDAIGDARLPAGVAVISAADADRDRLRLLDDTLRDDVPGTDGWRSTPQEFADDNFGDSEFDPRTYLVAVDERTGEYIGLVRVWMDPRRPRIGMFGVVRGHRRRGLMLALLAACLAAARESGHGAATSNHDETNEASRGVFHRLRAREVGSTVELKATGDPDGNLIGLVQEA